MGGRFNAIIRSSIQIPRVIGRFANAHVSAQFIDVVVAEVIAFALYGVLVLSIANANLSGSLKGQNGVLVGLVTLFYILAAALLPLGIVRKATGGHK
jgi:hypothetical protein